MSTKCLSLVCGNPIETNMKANSRKRFCCGPCRLDYWAFKRVAKQLYPFGKDRAWEEIESQEIGPQILDAVVNGGNPLTSEQLSQRIGVRCEVIDRAAKRMIDRGELNGV